jgi:hypothetical protein
MAAQVNPNNQELEVAEREVAKQLAEIKTAAEQLKQMVPVGKDQAAESSEQSRAEQGLVAAATAALVPLGGKLTFGAITG